VSETREYLHEKAMLQIETMVKVGKLRWCDVCGRPFKPYSPANVYCSFKCRREANRYRAKMNGRRRRCSR
jgi:predicted nucleic acid-binding Zn ribbon protein